MQESRAEAAAEGSAEPGEGRPGTALLDTLTSSSDQVLLAHLNPDSHPNPPTPPLPAVAIWGQYTPDLYIRKSEYTEKAASTGPFL